MSISDVEDIPKIVSEKRHIGIFIPPTTFGFLYIITALNQYLVSFLTLTIVSIIVYLGSDLPDHDLSISLPTPLEATTFSFLLVGYLAGILFLYQEHEVTVDVMATDEIVSVILMFMNVAFLTGWVLYAMFHE